MKKFLLGFCAIFSLLIVSCNYSNNITDDNATDDTPYVLQNGWYSFSVGGLSAPPQRSGIGVDNETFVVPYKSDIAWWGASYGWAYTGQYLIDKNSYTIRGIEAGKSCVVPGKYLSGFVTDTEPENPVFMEWDDEHHLNSIVVNGDVWNDSNSDGIWYDDDITYISIYDSRNNKCRFTVGNDMSDSDYNLYAEDGHNYYAVYYTCLDNPKIFRIGKWYIDGKFWRYEYSYKVDYYYMALFLDLYKEGSGYECGRIWR